MLGRLLVGVNLERYRSSPHKAWIDRVGTALVRQRYFHLFVRRHVHEWLRFLTDVEREGLRIPTKARGPAVERYIAVRASQHSPSFKRFVSSSIRIFLETDDDGHFRRRRGERILPSAPAWMVGPISRYLDFLERHRAVCAKTLSKRRAQLHAFGRFLEAIGLTALDDLRFRHLDDFVVHLDGRCHRTRLSYRVTLRGFARWAHADGLVPADLSVGALTARQYRDTQVPDVLTTAEVDQVLTSVDRTTVIGRRDYAVLLLAARYGMRPSDIRGLQLDHIDWRHGQIVFPQSKTGRVLTLPLLDDVADAVLAYLQRGRPATGVRHVFIRHRAPFEPFDSNNNLSTIMRQALARAGMADRRGSRGLYLLRRTRATLLLAAGTPLKTVGDILGHVSSGSTRVYTKVDVSALRTVAVSEAEVQR